MARTIIPVATQRVGTIAPDDLPPTPLDEVRADLEAVMEGQLVALTPDATAKQRTDAAKAVRDLLTKRRDAHGERRP